MLSYFQQNLDKNWNNDCQFHFAAEDTQLLVDEERPPLNTSKCLLEILGAFSCNPQFCKNIRKKTWTFNNFHTCHVMQESMILLDMWHGILNFVNSVKIYSE